MTEPGTIKGRVEFIDNHRPALPSGDYQIEATQTIAATRHDPHPHAGVHQGDLHVIEKTVFPSATHDFSVAGPRFTLNPQVIRSVFPPAGSLGEHSQVLPHISFSRSTLPWERFTTPLTEAEEEAFGQLAHRRTEREHQLLLEATTKLETPWLALLVFDETEVAGKTERSAATTPAESEMAERNLADADLTATTVSAPRPATLSALGSAQWGVQPSDGKPDPHGIATPRFARELGQQVGDTLTVIDVGGALLRAVLPSEPDVRLLAHARVPTDDDGVALAPDLGTVLANRLPRSGQMSTVHLVSLEARYGADEHTLWQLPRDTAFVRLVSLHSWRFACVDELHSFKGLLHHLNTEHLFELEASAGATLVSDGPLPDAVRAAFAANAIQLSPSARCAKVEEHAFGFWQVSDDDARYVVRHHAGAFDVLRALPHTLRLPSAGLAEAKDEVEAGKVALPHEMRQGNRSVSWYRGPMTPCVVEPTAGAADEGVGTTQRISHADELVRYNQTTAMFDVSYAAAWELGRQLTLQNQKVAMSLFEWKRHHRLSAERRTAMAGLEHLPVVGRPQSVTVPADVATWFHELALLKHVPFNYLVADEALLPPESIRFFSVDPEWVRCLHEGAFNVGRVLAADRDRDQRHPTDALRSPHALVTGFLLRSEVVSGWPDLVVDGYDELVHHRRFEHDRILPSVPIRPSVPSQSWLADELDRGATTSFARLFGFAVGSDLVVDTLVAGSRWHLNLNANETMFVLESHGGELHLSVQNQLPQLRFERLSPTILLVLFAGDVRTVDLHEKPEGLHFGVDAPGDDGSYTKPLRDSRGRETDLEIAVPFRSGQDRRVIEVDQLHTGAVRKLHPNQLPADSPALSGSGGFALQMTVGVQKVRFSERLD